MLQAHIGPSLQIALLLVDALGTVSQAALQAALKDSLGPRRLDRTMARLQLGGWVEATARTGGEEAVMRLTAAGRLAALGGREPEKCWRRRWDGRWRIAFFDLPESERALRLRLRRQLRALGFGCLQNSVWITPDPVDSLRPILRTTVNNVERLSFMEARPCGGASDAEVVLGAWDFERINRNYDIYLEHLAERPPRTREARTKWWQWEWRNWNHAIAADPLLPEALLPRSYRGQAAWEKRVAVLRGVLQTD